MLGMVERLLHEPSERLRTMILNLGANDRIKSGFPRVFIRPTLNVNAQRPNCETGRVIERCAALSVERLPPTLDERIRCIVSETDQHIPQTAAGLSLSAAMVFQTVVLHSRRDSSGGGAFSNGLHFQRRLRSQSAGQHVRPEQARSNGIGQCDPGSQRENLWPNLRREPRDSARTRSCLPISINAVIAVEDAKFYEHHGYDLLGIIRAALKNLTAGHVRQGASTITQQLARNSFSLKERTYRRKLLEIFLAKRIEDQFSKQKIMELYLNRIYFGGGMYGAEAAARGYFGKSAREMTLAECATLAGLIKSPNRLSPWTDRDNSREMRDFALDRMRDSALSAANNAPLPGPKQIAVGSRQAAQGQTYAVDYIRQQVIAAVGWDRAINEGYRIHTTIDVNLQRAAEDSLKAHLEQVEQHPDYNHQTYADYAASFRKAKASGKMADQPAPEYLQGAAIGLDNASGDILVLVGGRDFEHNQFNRALQARRPAGTAMLPFVYTTAFERGMYPGSVVEDSPLDNRAVMIGGTTGILGEWGPEDADNQYEGRMTARQALAKSKDGATVRIGMDAGIEAVLQLCSSAGIRSPLRPYPATFLGSSEVTLAELAMGYTIFPNGGWRPSTPHILERIEEKDGTLVWDGKQQSIRKIVTKPETAYEVHSCLVDALKSGTGKTAYTEFGLKKFPAAGKTGHGVRFHGRALCGIRFQSHLRCVGRF